MIGLVLLGIALVGVSAALVHRALSGAGDDAKKQFPKSQPAGDPCIACTAKKHPKVLNRQAAERATRKREKVSAEDRKTLDRALEQARSEEERAYILKAFAACHSAGDCAAFGRKIRGKSSTWMRNHLQLTGSTRGTGVRQQWSHSCNATTAQAIRGQMDPIYALKVHEDNPNFAKVDEADAMKENPNLATEQRDMLISTYSGAAAGSHSGVAVARGAAGGSGRWGDDLFNRYKNSTGVEYTTQKDPADPVGTIDAGLRTGAPVPIVIGSGAGSYAHYVLVTGSRAGPPKTYTVHDPASGTTVTRTAADVQDGKVDLAGWNHVTAIESPKRVAREAPGKPPC